MPDLLDNQELDLTSNEAVNYVQNLSKLHERLTKSTQDTASLHAIFEEIQHRNRLNANNAEHDAENGKEPL
ncbi:hypothetical protein J5I95_17595 [Candidatus Poribacteria bacterium]|nr:hypothetical protein [Candidatus Poribacteria bacterium]